MIAYLKNSIWDMVICIIISAAMCTAVFNAFHATDSVAGTLVPTVLPVIILVVLFTIWLSGKRSFIIGLVIMVVCAALFIVITSGRGAFSDQAGNPYLQYILQFIITLLVFLLSRTRAGTAIMLAAGVIVLCTLEMIYGYNQIWCLIIFIGGCGVMLIYRYYIGNVIRTNTVSTAPGRSALYGAILCIMILILSTGVFFGIVRPLDPPKQDITLFTRFMSMDVLERIGVVGTIEEPDKLQDTDQNNDEKETREPGQAEEENEAENNEEEMSEDQMIGNAPSYAVKHTIHDYGILLIIILIIIVIAAAIFLKRLFRKRRSEEIRKLEPNGQISAMYKFYLKSFEKLGVGRLKDETPYEYAERIKPVLESFKVGETDFSELTETYVTCAYGTEPIREKDVSKYWKYYDNFYKNIRKFTGGWKYLWMFFRL